MEPETPPAGTPLDLVLGMISGNADSFLAAAVVVVLVAIPMWLIPWAAPKLFSALFKVAK